MFLSHNLPLSLVEPSCLYKAQIVFCASKTDQLLILYTQLEAYCSMYSYCLIGPCKRIVFGGSKFVIFIFFVEPSAFM